MSFHSIFRSTMPQLFLRYSIAFLDQLCPNYAPTIPAILHSMSTMPQLCPNYAPTMPQLCPNYAPSMHFAPTMPEFCPNYAPTMFRQTTDLPENHVNCILILRNVKLLIMRIENIQFVYILRIPAVYSDFSKMRRKSVVFATVCKKPALESSRRILRR